MKIENVIVRKFHFKSCKIDDSYGHAHPGSEHDSIAAVLEIVSNDGTTGRIVFSPPLAYEEILWKYIRPVLVGQDPMRIEYLWNALYKWQRGSGGQLTDRILGGIDQALWDLKGKVTDQPVWKLLGGYRETVAAYGSTMCGDDMEGGLATPEDYGLFAEWMVRDRGYRAIKLHTWMPPIPGAPSVEMDYAACAAVREAVGPGIKLMLDPNHWYSRADTLWLGQKLEELGFFWMEEPMEEASISSYRWLSENLRRLNILGPETMSGKHWTRAEWISSGACDMLRTGVFSTGGITPSIKIAHLAESFNTSCEIHGSGVGNMAVAAAIPNTTFYERGLLHPFIDYEQPRKFLNTLEDPMDSSGDVHLSSEPGLGLDLNLEFIDENEIV